MHDTSILQSLFSYSDSVNRQVLAAAATLDDAALDRTLDIGLGSLRRILHHILNGEATWLHRCQGEIETKWPDETESMSLSEMRDRLESVFAGRTAFLRTATIEKLSTIHEYRDSRGSLFRATLQDMLLQTLVHSTHHRAQVVNAIRRLGGSAPEVDYMVARRQSVVA